MPILIYDGGDFIFLNNIKDAENFLEPFDVEQGEIVVFDSNQQVLKFIVQKGRWFDAVECVGIDEKESELDVRTALAKYIAQRTGDTSYLAVSWDNLIRFVTESLLPKN